MLSDFTNQETETQRCELIKLIWLFSWFLGWGLFQKGGRKVEVFKNYLGTVTSALTGGGWHGAERLSTHRGGAWCWETEYLTGERRGAERLSTHGVVVQCWETEYHRHGAWGWETEYPQGRGLVLRDWVPTGMGHGVERLSTHRGDSKMVQSLALGPVQTRGIHFEGGDRKNVSAEKDDEFNLGVLSAFANSKIMHYNWIYTEAQTMRLLN